MKKTTHPVDDIFLDGLAEEQDMPPFSAWENIEQALDKHAITTFEAKHNRLQKIIIVLLVLLAAVSFFTYKTYKTTTSEIANVTAVVDTKNNLPNEVVLNKKHTTASKIKKQNTQTTNVVLKKPKANTSDDNTNLTSSIQNKKSTTSGNTISATSLMNKTVFVPVKKVSVVQSKPTIDTTSTTIHQITSTKPKQPIYSPAKTINQTFRSNIINNKSIIPDLPIDKNEIVPEIIHSNISNLEEEVDASYTDKKLHLVPLGEIKPERNLLVGLSSPSIITTISGSSTIKFTSNSANSTSEGMQANTQILKAKPHLQWSVLPLISVNKVNEYITTTEYQSARRDYLRKQITENENASLSIAAGISVEVDLNKRFSLETGIGYYEKNTSIKPRTITAEKDREGKVKYRFDCSAGTYYIDPKLGTAPVLGDSTKSFYANNKLQYLTLPIIAKYHLITGKINWYQLVGGSVNMLAGQNFTTEIDNSFSEKLQNIKTNDLNKVYFTAMVGAGIDYSISKRIAFRISPIYRFSVTPINKNENIKTYPNSFTVMGGLKIALGH